MRLPPAGSSISHLPKKQAGVRKHKKKKKTGKNKRVRKQTQEKKQEKTGGSREREGNDKARNLLAEKPDWFPFDVMKQRAEEEIGSYFQSNYFQSKAVNSKHSRKTKHIFEVELKVLLKYLLTIS